MTQNRNLEAEIGDLQKAFKIMQANQQTLHENFERLRNTTEALFKLVEMMRRQITPMPVSGRN